MTARRTDIRNAIVAGIIDAMTSVSDRVTKGQTRALPKGGTFPAAAVFVPEIEKEPAGLSSIYTEKATIAIEVYVRDPSPGASADQALEEGLDNVVEEIEFGLLKSQTVLALFEKRPALKTTYGTSAETAERLGIATIMVMGQLKREIAPGPPLRGAFKAVIKTDLIGPHGTAQDTETGPNTHIEVEQRITLGEE